MKVQRSILPSIRPAWLLTYGDMVTLLLAFFVLLVSMGSMETRILASISMGGGTGAKGQSSGDLAPERVQEAVAMLEGHNGKSFNESKAKSLLFPDIELPESMLKGNAEQNMRILQTGQGIAIVLANSLLFEKGSSTISKDGEKLLASLTPVIHSVDRDVNIAGFAEEDEPITVASKRALSVLDILLASGVKPARFTISAYKTDAVGQSSGNSPLKSQRHVEILVKVADNNGYAI